MENMTTMMREGKVLRETPELRKILFNGIIYWFKLRGDNKWRLAKARKEQSCEETTIMPY